MNGKNQKQKERESSGGFTFVEILLVVVLLGVVAGLSIPHFSQSYKTLQVQNIANNIVYLMRYAQSRAIIKNTTVRLVFDGPFERYWLEQAQEIGQGDEISFARIEGRWGRRFSVSQEVEVSMQDSFIKFYPDGKIDKNEASICRDVSQGKQDCVMITTKWQPGYIHLVKQQGEG
ncbi:MAG: hypothetical protein KAJ18_03435 [Candidatus Omnitrophica bacterium]|nr:hypothetical protein [Candidatus Omnitrophota bacterium]